MAWNSGLSLDTPAYIFAASEATRLRAMAGPGTGKSFALQRRVARLLEQGVNPARLLAVTFTRTAAADLKKEIASINVPGADKVIACTLHSFCFSILSKEEVLSQLGRQPRPLLEHEIKPLLRDLIDNRFGNIRAKTKKIRDFESAWARLQHEEPGYALTPIDETFETVLERWLIFHKAMLIGEIIPKTLSYLRDNPVCPERSMFDHLLVDEYQDLNKAEQVLISLLVGDGTLAIVGDDDQSIYSFRNAHPDGIRIFPNEHKDCASVSFDKCYRCPSLVTDMASRLIRNNTCRTLGNLVSHEGNDMGEVLVLQWNTLEEEIKGIVEIIRFRLNNGLQSSDILVLTPRRKIGYRIRNLLNSSGVKVRSYFRETALDSDEAKEAYSLLNFAADQFDRVALRYLLGYGSTDFRVTSYARLENKARELGIDVKKVLDKIASNEISIPYTSHLVEIYQVIMKKLTAIVDIIQKCPVEIVEYLAPQGSEAHDDLRDALVTAIDHVGDGSAYEDKNQWLINLYKEVRDLISMPDVPDKVDHVRVMSLHSSKGLSSKLVVICPCIEGFIPVDSSDKGLNEEELAKELEEQRRLFYVAITRCKNYPEEYPGTLILSSCREMSGAEAKQLGLLARIDRPRRLIASRFLRELGPNRPKAVTGRDYLTSLR